jgi:hypothetical protein
MPCMPPRTTRKSIAPEIEPVPLEPTIIEEDTITFKRSHFYAVLSVLTFGFGILVGYALWGTNLLPGAGSNSPAANQSAVTSEPGYIRYDIPTEGGL